MADTVFELAIRGTWNGKQVANVLHCVGDAAGVGLDVFAQEVADAFYRDHSISLDNAFSMGTWAAREISLNPAQFEGALTTPATGVGSVVPTPNQTAMVVTTRTGFAGRRKRGRHYLCGWMSDKIQQDGRWLTSLVTQIQTAIDALIAGGPYGTGAYYWVVWSARNGETRDAQGNLISVNMVNGASAVTECVVRNIPATQRRRRIG